MVKVPVRDVIVDVAKRSTSSESRTSAITEHKAVARAGGSAPQNTRLRIRQLSAKQQRKQYDGAKATYLTRERQAKPKGTDKTGGNTRRSASMGERW